MMELSGVKKPNKDGFIEPVISPLRNTHFKNHSAIRRFFDWRLGRRKWILREDWIVWVECIKCWAKIPKGFIFDGASVPKILHSIVNSTDALFYGSIIHDFIYRTNQLIVCSDDDYGKWALGGSIGKSIADEILLRFSIDVEGLKLPAHIAYTGLYPFGFIAWHSLRKRGWELKSANPPFDDKVLRGPYIYGDTDK